MLATIVITAKAARTKPETAKSRNKSAFCFSCGIDVTSRSPRTRGFCVGTATFIVSTYFSANATRIPFFLNYPFILLFR